MEQTHIGELGNHVGHHGGTYGSKSEPLHSEEHIAIGAGQQSAQPKDEYHPAIEQQPHPNQLRGFLLAPQFTDEVGAEKGDRIGQSADRHDDRPLTNRSQGQKASEPKDVEHPHRSEKQTSQDQEGKIAALCDISS